MSLSKEKYIAYCEILKQELMPATGCTEPIAIAYAAAIAGETLGKQPEIIEAGLSGNIIKNVKSVVVPSTGGMRGIEAAIAAGIVAGCPEKELQILSVLTQEERNRIKECLDTTAIKIEHVESGHIFDIDITAKADNHMVRVRITDFHTNVVLIEKDGVKIKEQNSTIKAENINIDRKFMNVKDIIEFAEEVKLDEISALLESQIACNMAISEEGLRNSYGANIGKILLSGEKNDVRQKARALAAAGSDARMNGCELPVFIVSGSGNQGITASVPVIVYAMELNKPHDVLLRSLVVSNLITIHQKTGIGRLSAYCGVISAGCGAGAGIAYLCGGRYEEIAHTIVNAVAILSGTVCDGAKSSCAAKISMAVEAGILGYEMFQNGQQFYGGDGIVSKGVENTIDNVGRLAKIGMSGTDKEIMKIMIGK